MRKMLKIVQLCVIIFSVFCCLFFINFFLLAGINVKTKNDLANMNIKNIAQTLQETENGFALSQKAQEKIDQHDGFAILIGNDGHVIWEYKRPAEIPLYYTRADIASFSRWYLQDYPVNTWIVDGNIFVVGQPKGTIWKYEISYGMKTMEAYIVYLPIALLVNVVLLIIIPICLYKKSTVKKERQRTEWIAGVSHDVRTPLALVLGNASVIKERAKDDDILEKADLIEKHAIRMRTLIANLNMENKLSYGIGKWNQEDIMLSALIRDVICDVMNQEENELFDFDLYIEQELEDYKIWADPDLIRRLLENLVWNAIYHNPQGCCIHIALQRKQGERKTILFTISDEGKGVSSEQLTKLNKKLSNDTLPEHGLGIRLVKHIATLYHWRLRFSNTQAGGLACEIKIKHKNAVLTII